MQDKENIKGNAEVKRIGGILLEISAAIGRADFESMDAAELRGMLNRIELVVTQARRHMEEGSD